MNRCLQFIKPMLESTRASSIVQSTVQLATALQLLVVAEGVEDRATLAALERIGCTQAQGFYIGRPTTAEVVAAKVLDEVTALGRLPAPAHPS